MKILAIRGCNLASLAGPFALEFERDPLAAAGLFAITGPTGAGKSTLLDALCVALFDRTPRLASRGGALVGRADEDEAARLPAHDVRALLRRGTGSGYAEVDFAGRDGRRYRARWSVRRARERPEGRFQPQAMELCDLESGRDLGGTKAETLAAIEARLGFSFAQFCRSALLAQGEFAAFLRADARQRAELLERMTGTEIYGAVSEAAFRRAAAETRELAHLLRLSDEHAVLKDEERDELEATRVAAQKQWELARHNLGEIERALAWHARLESLGQGVAAAGAELAAAESHWETLWGERRELDAVVAAQVYRGVIEAADRTRQALSGAEQVAAATRQNEVAARAELEAAQQRVAAAQRALDGARGQESRAEPALAEARRLDRELAAARQAVAAAQESRRAADSEWASARAERNARRRERRAAATRLCQERAALAARPHLEPVAREWSRWDSALGRLRESSLELAARQAERESLVADLEEASAEHTEARHALRQAQEALAEARAAATRAESDAAAAPLEMIRAEREQLAGLREGLGALAAAGESARAAAAARQAACQRAALARGALAAAEGEELCWSGERARAIERLGEAENSLDRLRLAADLAQHRLQLVAGEPCPLCGATEHPLAKGETPSGRVASTQRSRVDKLRAQVREAEKQLARAAERRLGAAREAEAADEEAARAAEQLAAAQRLWRAALEQMQELGLAAAPETRQAAAWVEARRRAAEDRWAELRQADATATAAHDSVRLANGAIQQRLAALEAVREAVRKWERRSDQALAALAALDQAQTRARGQRDAALAELAGGFAAWPGWREQAAADPAAFRSHCEREVACWQAHFAAADQASRRLAALEPALAAAKTRAIDRKSEAKRCDEIAGERAAAEQRLVSARAALFTGRDADDVARALGRAVAERRQALEQAIGERERAAATAAARAAHCSAADRAFGQARDSWQEACAALDRALAAAHRDEADLRALLARDAAWIDRRREMVAEARGELDRARAIFAERRAQEAAHRDDHRPALEKDHAEAELAAKRRDLEAAAEAVAALVARLRADDIAREKRARLAEQVAAQRRRAELYQSLSDLIGSADGKQFRTFAQSLTLDILLALANEHLGQLADRYRLARVPGSDLDLQVIDRTMGDEVRSVHSLSGGESFLVSLALALGLSSLAARDARVESLLIDEGFGTLDPDTLEVALAVLDELQASGRKVGLISHVPNLIERIGVCIAVTPRGAGRSAIRIQAPAMALR